jgi:hypothetical protein
MQKGQTFSAAEENIDLNVYSGSLLRSFPRDQSK